MPSFWVVVTRGASQKGYLWCASTLKSPSGGVSFRKLVRLGSLSFGDSQDFAPINSGPMPSDDTFHFIPSFPKFSRRSQKQRFRRRWLAFNLSSRFSKRFVYSLLALFLTFVLGVVCLWSGVWLRWWEQCDRVWESGYCGGKYLVGVAFCWSLLRCIGVVLVFSRGFLSFSWMCGKGSFYLVGWRDGEAIFWWGLAIWLMNLGFTA